MSSEDHPGLEILNKSPLNDHIDEFAGLSEFQTTLADATEILAAFISTGRSEELPIASLIEAAEKSLADLTGWHDSLKGVLAEPGLRSYLNGRDLH